MQMRQRASEVEGLREVGTDVEGEGEGEGESEER